MPPILVQANFGTINGLQIEFDRIGEKIQINHLLIAGISCREMCQLRNALISAVGFPASKDLEEIDIDIEGISDAVDKMTAFVDSQL